MTKLEHCVDPGLWTRALTAANFAGVNVAPYVRDHLNAALEAAIAELKELPQREPRRSNLDDGEETPRVEGGNQDKFRNGLSGFVG